MESSPVSSSSRLRSWRRRCGLLSSASRPSKLSFREGAGLLALFRFKSEIVREAHTLGGALGPSSLVSTPPRCRRPRVMGLLALQRFLSLRRGRRRRQTRARGTSIASVVKRKGSPFEQGDSSQDDKRMRFSGPDLPMDIWHHMHSLLPMRDAARASCVSHAFRYSWRCYPNLTFSKSTMGLNEPKKSFKWNRKYGRNFLLVNRTDQIMKNHLGGIKTFEFQYSASCLDISKLDTSKLDGWLQIAVTSGVEELEISLSLVNKTEHYNLPCALLFARSGGNSIRSLHLSGCAFRPMAGLGCLTRLHLYWVHITEDELGCFLSNSFALEELDLMSCSDIIHLKIPCLLNRLSKLEVVRCV